MILWKSKEELYESSYIFGNRWVIEINKWAIGLSRQYKSKNDNKWHDIHSDYAGIVITKHFLFGDSHAYYDGPHCCFSLGWIHFHYTALKSWCEKCYGRE